MQAISGLISVMRDLKGQDSFVRISVLSSVNSNPTDYSKYLGLCERFWRENSDHRFCNKAYRINRDCYTLSHFRSSYLHASSILLLL